MTYRTKAGGLRALAVLVLLFACVQLRASVAVLLEEPYGDMGRVNPTGHSAIYFNHVCAESATVLRPCRAGEMGAVISRYDGVGRYDWLAMPLVPYLYAVDSASDVPLAVDKQVVAIMRDTYRRANLETVAPDLPYGMAPGGNWYELAGSAYDRTIYGFQVKTTAEQDASVIALFNDRGNRERYNAAFRNCADFARVTINRFYPHAIRRNFIADFGIETPKSVARSLTHYGDKHAEAELTVFKVPQVPGTLPRSHHTQGLAEGLLKDYGIPIVLISPVTASVLLAAYVEHGRFSLPKNAPVLQMSSMERGTAMAEAQDAADLMPLVEILSVDGVIESGDPLDSANPGMLPVESAEAIAAERKILPADERDADTSAAGMNTSPVPVSDWVAPAPNRVLQYR